jgi:hypothetical protein
VSEPNLWFPAAAATTKTIGTVPGTGLRYALDPGGTWAVSNQPVARQQREHPAEFAVLPDALLHSMGYRLSTIAGAVLPQSLMSVIEQGPEALNAATHPFEPALMQVDDTDLFGGRRAFDELAVYVSIHGGHWICVLCPADVSPVLAAVSARS